MEYCLQDFLDGRICVHTITKEQLVDVLTCVIDNGGQLRGHMSIERYLNGIVCDMYDRYVALETERREAFYGFFLACLPEAEHPRSVEYEAFSQMFAPSQPTPMIGDIDDLF